MTIIRTIDAHTAGEPLRLIVDGFPRVEGQTMLERRAWVGEHQRSPAHGADARAARPRRHVRRAADRARARRLGCRRALHAQPGLQHDVRPRRDRRRDAGDRARADRAAAAATRSCSTRRPGRSTRARTVRRDGERTRVERRQLRQRAVVRACTPACRCGSDRATVRADVAFGGAFYAIVDSEAAGIADPCRSGSTICGARAWRSSTRSRPP